MPARLHRPDDRHDRPTAEGAQHEPRPPAPPATSRAPTPRDARRRSCASWSPTSGAELELAPAEVIIEWAVATFGDRFAITSSMGDAVLAHLASKVAPGIDVVFLDTGYHFAETIGTRDAVEATLPVNLLTITPVADRRRAGRGVRQGPLQDRPRPVLRAAQGQAARRHAGRVRRLGHRPAPRRDPQPGHRAGRRLGRHARARSRSRPWPAGATSRSTRYIVDNGVLVNPLVHDGYPSIGCWPCTRRVAPGDDPRSGRWAGTTKTECGIHA